MRTTWMVAALLVAGTAGAQGLKTEDEKTVYALGYLMGKNIKRDFALSPAELAVFKKGLEDAAKDAPAAVKPEEYEPKIQALAGSRAKSRADKEKEKGKAWLEKAALEKGAQKLPSGVIYQEQKAGTGPSPTAEDTVTVHYRGTLTDGTEFDSSYKRNEPTSFPLKGVIPCWTEGVQKMKVGGKAKLTCPSDKAYGDRGAPPKIPGGATLVFEVELKEIKGKK
ncbi:MAG: FKBP-type peptidyl-prolyl cis-trans isomerase [Deltaproteobacteria bacterium]|nr:FKBP-type peptidyl-prolyl cis-trans isomerase [Deltaproteobacteria bacterium]